jgi:alpha-galactosidase
VAAVMTITSEFVPIADIELGPTAHVYESGWQSWSVSTTYRRGVRPHRPRPESATMNGWGTRPAPPDIGYQGEGLLAIDPGSGAGALVVGAADPLAEVPTIRAHVDGSTLRITANEPVDVVPNPDGTSITSALSRWADDVAAAATRTPIRSAPTVWCSWYHYFTKVRETDIDENLAAITDQDLPFDVVQLDDGYQAEIGDWLTLSDRFGSLTDLADRIKAAGRRAGIWLAPFLVGANSAVMQDHPDWLIGTSDRPMSAGSNWGQQVFGLDLTHPGVRAYLDKVFATLRGFGFDFFKLDFLYAGALDGGRHEDMSAVAAYRSGLELIRRAIGTEAYLLGCGAPILPSIGLVDAMRVSPDTGPEFEPLYGDLTAPAGRSAILTGVGRAWQHGRWWVNDPDCLLARPEVERREELARHVERYGGLRGSSDRIASLDAWGLETTRRLCSDVPPPTPFPDLPDSSSYPVGLT